MTLPPTQPTLQSIVNPALHHLKPHVRTKYITAGHNSDITAVQFTIEKQGARGHRCTGVELTKEAVVMTAHQRLCELCQQFVSVVVNYVVLEGCLSLHGAAGLCEFTHTGRHCVCVCVCVCVKNQKLRGNTIALS